MTKTNATTNNNFIEQKESSNNTWSQIVRHALTQLGGIASLHSLYSIIERHPRAAQSAHWKAKCRQLLECSDSYVRVDKGVWGFSSRFSKQEVEQFEALRRARYPRRSRETR